MVNAHVQSGFLCPKKEERRKTEDGPDQDQQQNSLQSLCWVPALMMNVWWTRAVYMFLAHTVSFFNPWVERFSGTFRGSSSSSLAQSRLHEPNELRVRPVLETRNWLVIVELKESYRVNPTSRTPCLGGTAWEVRTHRDLEQAKKRRQIELGPLLISNLIIYVPIIFYPSLKD